jgi:hypothetical protein
MDTEVLFLRLKNGEDLITEVQELDKTYILMNPCKILYLKGSKTGYLSISLMQWVFARICSDQTFEIEKNEVLFKTIPEDTLTEHYWNSVDHFLNMESKDKVEYDSMTESYDEEPPMTTEEGIELIKKLLEIKSDKGKLH